MSYIFRKMVKIQIFKKTIFRRTSVIHIHDTLITAARVIQYYYKN